jgi:hypothetical protein
MRTSKVLAALPLALSMLAAPIPAFAGGPLVIVPTAEGLKPARWEGTVPVYIDVGGLGVVNSMQARTLLRKSLRSWSSVETSSFRAEIAGTTNDLGLGDITGANAGSIIGADNGGGLHVIFDADGTVLTDFLGAGFGVLGIATPEFLEGEGSRRIVEGWVVITGQGEGVEEVVTGAPLSGVITHELGHAIGLAHSQTNGLYFRNQPIEAWGLPAGAERAGPDQCPANITTYPTADQVETMYPFIDPYPTSPTYNSPGMATVNVADDKSALSTLYPAPGFRQATGRIVGRVLAADGESELTGINVIARNAAKPFDAISRISGDRTQGLIGADGSFEIVGLIPGASYVLYVDQLGPGGFSTPKGVLLGPEENWNANESGDATIDNPCAATRIVVSAGETRSARITLNAIHGAPAFTYLPNSLPIDLSDDGGRVVGLFGPFQSPYWVWSEERGMRDIGGVGFMASISSDGRVVGGSLTKRVETPFGPQDQERAAIWTREVGWRSIASNQYEGCDIFHTTIFDINADGTAAAGLAFEDCSHVFAFKWTQLGGMRRLGKTSEGAARANAISADGNVIGGWEEIPEAGGYRVGSIWEGQGQMLLSDHDPQNPFGYVGEVMALNGSGKVAVGYGAGAFNKDAYKWTATEGLVNIGKYPGEVCYTTFDWETGEPIEVCEERETLAFSVSNDGKVITGASRLLLLGIDDAAIYTRGLGWMLMSEFLARQGVLEMARWQVLGARVSGNGKVLTGTAFPLAADYYQGYRLEIDHAFVCHGPGHRETLSVEFPEEMDQHLKHGDTFGLCMVDAPLRLSDRGDEGR